MEFNVAPPRADHAAQTHTPLLRAAARSVAVKPETANPVTAAEPISFPAPIKGLGIKPLDVMEVGDNDDIPQPPAPPHEASVLAIMSYHGDTAMNGPVAVDMEAQDAAASQADAPEQGATGGAAALPALLKSLDPHPGLTTVDIRR